MTTFVPVWTSNDESMTAIQLMSAFTLPAGTYPTVQSGMEVEAADDSLGWGKFIFAQASAAAGVAAGDVCEMQSATLTFGTSVVMALGAQKWQGTTITGKSLAVALVALTQNQWGWFQIFGSALLNSNGAVAANDKVYWQANGVVSSTPVAGKQMVNAQAMVANSASFGQVVGGTVQTLSATQAVYYINYPYSQGAIT